jgi:hypothetical protein
VLDAIREDILEFISYFCVTYRMMGIMRDVCGTRMSIDDPFPSDTEDIRDNILAVIFHNL